MAKLKTIEDYQDNNWEIGGVGLIHDSESYVISPSGHCYNTLPLLHDDCPLCALAEADGELVACSHGEEAEREIKEAGKLVKLLWEKQKDETTFHPAG